MFQNEAAYWNEKEFYPLCWVLKDLLITLNNTTKLLIDIEYIYATKE